MNIRCACTFAISTCSSAVKLAGVKITAISVLPYMIPEGYVEIVYCTKDFEKARKVADLIEMVGYSIALTQDS